MAQFSFLQVPIGFAGLESFLIFRKPVPHWSIVTDTTLVWGAVLFSFLRVRLFPTLIPCSWQTSLLGLWETFSCPSFKEVAASWRHAHSILLSLGVLKACTVHLPSCGNAEAPSPLLLPVMILRTWHLVLSYIGSWLSYAFVSFNYILSAFKAFYYIVGVDEVFL